ncbi:MAG: glycosyltransferase [Clostridia bacterium]|nr:glycosyltransferase [Clostridia bacterium]
MNENENKEKKLKILLLLSESWNDISAPNNNMTNWFSGLDNVEVWTVSGNGALPNNSCCKDYFLISEGGMLRSLYRGGRVGEVYHFEDFPKNEPLMGSGGSPRLFANCARLARDIVWRFGRYDKVALKSFIEDFRPDIVFSQRMGSVKMCTIERLVRKYTDAPMVAYTGDDEFSLRQFSLSPVYWIRRLWVRSMLKKNIAAYKLFYSQSERQMAEFARHFKTPTKFLVKCGEFDKEKIHKSVNKPIQLVYAGKLYCNRWKSLAMIARAIREINESSGEPRLCLNIYTRDKITKKQNKLLNDGVASIIHGGVPASALPKIYAGADIALHVESFDLKNRLLTKDSFSTKVMDCMASGCAVMAVCWHGHSAGVYLKSRGGAMVANSYGEILQQLSDAAENPERILEYSRLAYEVGAECHDKKNIQKMIISDFERVISGC